MRWQSEAAFFENLKIVFAAAVFLRAFNRLLGRIDKDNFKFYAAGLKCLFVGQVKCSDFHKRIFNLLNRPTYSRFADIVFQFLDRLENRLDANA
ncbi:hypothetical protein LDFHOB_00375 [Candidatus Electronema aureum]